MCRREEGSCGFVEGGEWTVIVGDSGADMRIREHPRLFMRMQRVGVIDGLCSPDGSRGRMGLLAALLSGVRAAAFVFVAAVGTAFAR